ncbi:MAG TPA: glycosyltransferase [Baekduia sp.]|nr:glycosyltransferase [Baekduia sp.]
MPTSPALRVSRVLAKLEPGGAQLSVLRVVRALEAEGIGSRLLVGWASPEGLALARRMGVAVEVYGDAGDLQWRADAGFARWLAPRVAGAPVVHAHMFGAWWAAAQVVGETTALVASEHNALTWPHGRPAVNLRATLERVDRFYAHGPGARRAVLAAGLPPSRMWPGTSPVADLDAEPLAGLARPRIVFAGRLHPEKGPDVLVDALARVPGAPPALLLGGGAMRPQLEAQIVRLGLGDRVRLVGWQNRPGPWIAGAAMLVVPSRDEAWSQTAVLGMALGVPVIGTDVDGFPETLAAGRGLIVAAEDPGALATAIADLLTGRRRTDLAGARAYARRFSAENVTASYASAYRELGLGAARLALTTTVHAS